ncbi:MAG: NAD(P)H-dependent oxidoreductase [Ilumatobacteraceae bacterium]
MKILVLVGSLRAGSINRAVASALPALAPADVEFEVFEGMGDVPLYNQDLDTAEPPAAVAHLRDSIRAADALLFLTPEYNHSIPGVLKNAIDWASRPMFDSCLTGKSAAVVVSGPGRGGVRAFIATAGILRDLAVHVILHPEVVLNEAFTKLEIAADGTATVVDPVSAKLLGVLLDQLRLAALERAGDTNQRTLHALRSALMG